MNPKDDPIVAEVRKARQEHAERLDYELPAIFAALKQQEQQNPSPKALFPPKRIPIPMEDYGALRTLLHVFREDVNVSYGGSVNQGQNDVTGQG
jgi:hypothetical protein